MVMQRGILRNFVQEVFFLIHLELVIRWLDAAEWVLTTQLAKDAIFGGLY